MVRKIRQYSKEFKEEAVRLSLKSNNVSETAKDLGIPSGTLSGWIYALKKQGTLTQLTAKGSKDMATLIEENRRLHRALLIKEERDILKKAAAYFAQHQK